MLTIALAGCGATGTWRPQPSSSAQFPLPPPPTLVPVATASTLATLPPIAPLPVPAQPYLVGRRVVDLSRDDRPLPTLLLFPAVDTTRGLWDVAPGAFPLVVFSHGLRGSPDLYAAGLEPLAAAGFVVAAPEYPHTSLDATDYDPGDLLNQPADASAVLSAVLALAANPQDGLFGHIDATRVAAAGHSAGGYTTLGLLTYARDYRVRAAVVLSGASLGGRFDASATPVLFVHGDSDEVVPYAYGRTSHDQMPWPKAFLTVLGADHAGYLRPTSPAYPVVTATVLEFLRATLYGDVDALARIPIAATSPLTRFESTLPTGPTSATPTPTDTPQPTQTPELTATPSPSANASPSTVEIQPTSTGP